MIVTGVMMLTIWLGFLIPQYAAWKNKCYRTVAVCLSALTVSIASFVAMLVYGRFLNVLLDGVENAHTDEVSDWVLCILGFVCVVGHFFCWWYIYGRKSLDFIHLKGHTADELKQILSPKCKKMLGLK